MNCYRRTVLDHHRDPRRWVIVVIVLVLATTGSAGSQALSLCADVLALVGTVGAASAAGARIRPEGNTA
ncbi:hypothetical protein [Streptomyces sp. NRRL S-241]|uniref:hypothetical protein n=1 Tax=Streptomyces sp. NRRL S-241 TaxID=1463896 RepID=UPI0004C162CF|nr:hypothetical protein [Streptomyces sp. NRRL S-241]